MVTKNTKKDLAEKFAVKKASHGLGLFSKVAFKKGDFIIEYTGEKISTDEADRRGGQYLFRLNDDWVLDGKGREHLARYINHACKPNAYAEIDEDEKHIYIYAKKKIASGEEINYHYGKEFWKEYIEPKGCRCKTCLAKRGKSN